MLENLLYYLSKNESTHFEITELGAKAPIIRHRPPNEGDKAAAENATLAQAEFKNAFDVLANGRYVLTHGHGSGSGSKNVEARFEKKTQNDAVSGIGCPASGGVDSNTLERLLQSAEERLNATWETRFMRMIKEQEEKEKERRHKEEIEKLREELRQAKSWEGPVNLGIQGIAMHLGDLFKKPGSPIASPINGTGETKTQTDAESEAQFVESLKKLQDKLGDDFLPAIEKLAELDGDKLKMFYGMAQSL